MGGGFVFFLPFSPEAASPCSLRLPRSPNNIFTLSFAPHSSLLIPHFFFASCSLAQEWLPPDVLRASNPEVGDNFGWVAVSGDGLVLFVGADMEDSASSSNSSDNSADRSGAGYL